MPHSGENIAAQILEILESYEILDKLGYITLDNAANMDSAAEEIAKAQGLDPPNEGYDASATSSTWWSKLCCLGTRLRHLRLMLIESQGWTLLSMESGVRKGLSASSTT